MTAYFDDGNLTSRERRCTCGKVYPIESDSVHIASINGKATGCTACIPSERKRDMHTAKTRIMAQLARHIAKQRQRTIYRDVAVRYLQRFGGQTFSVRTGIDTADIYLENAKGQILGSVSYSDKYPKPPDTDYSDIPY